MCQMSIELDSAVNVAHPLLRRVRCDKKSMLLVFEKKLCVIYNVFRTKSVIEPEKLLVHGSLVGPAVEPVMS